MKLLILFGPPAVGKATVGKVIESLTNFKLFHNHMVMDGIMHIFGVGSPAEDRLSKLVRASIIEEAAMQGTNLIFTYVWNFGSEKGKVNIDRYKEIYESHGGEVYFVELTAPLKLRVERAGSSDRRLTKAHAPDPERVVYLEENLSFGSPSPFFYPEAHVKIDTTNKTPEQVAGEIIEQMHIVKAEY